MKLIETTNMKEFDEFVKAHPNANIMQSSSWAKVKQEDWKPHYLMFEDEGEIIGTALLLERSAIMNKSLFYAPRGFITDYTDNRLEEIIKLAKDYVKNHNGFVLRIDPELPLKVFDYNTREVLVDNRGIYNDLKAFMKTKPLTLEMSHTSQPRFQMVVDLHDDLLAKIKSKRRKMIKEDYLAKKGYSLIEDTSEYGVKEFARISRLTEANQKIALRNENYFMNMYNAFKDNNEIKIYFAELNIDNLLANTTNEKEIAFLKEYQSKNGNIVRTNALMCIYGTDMVQMFYGASDPEFQKYEMGFSLQLKIILDAKEDGYHYFNMGGVQGTFDDGLTKFKSKFHPLVFEYMGDFDIVINKMVYFAFEKGLKVYKKIRR